MSVATGINGVLKQDYDTTVWVPFYTTVVSAIGTLVTFVAFANYNGSWLTITPFVIAAILTELVGIELFAKSRSALSMGFVVAIAAMVALGPWAGSITGLVSGMATTIAADFLFNQAQQSRPRASLLRRAFFNISIRLLSVTVAGFVFIGIGGTPSAPITMSTLAPLILAVIVDHVVGLSLLMTVIKLQTQRRFRQIWQQDWQWTTPIILVSGVVGGGGLAFAYSIAEIIGVAIFMLPVLATGYAFHLYISHTRSYVDQLETANHQLEATNLDLLHTLSSVIDAYDVYTFGHSKQVARYAGAIAQAMDLAPTEAAKIVRGALIHDIGKVGVTDEIIGKPGSLTDDEFAMMKLHTVIGAEIISQMPQLQELVPMVRNHHERWDGRGYPDGLKGEESPLPARILAVADSVEAMLSDRPYRTTRSLADVVQEVKECSGRQFDPLVVSAFLAVAETHGSDFFINSAAKVAQELAPGNNLDKKALQCHVKKSMSLHLLNFTQFNNRSLV